MYDSVCLQIRTSESTSHEKRVTIIHSESPVHIIIFPIKQKRVTPKISFDHLVYDVAMACSSVHTKK